MIAYIFPIPGPDGNYLPTAVVLYRGPDASGFVQPEIRTSLSAMPPETLAVVLPAIGLLKANAESDGCTSARIILTRLPDEIVMSDAEEPEEISRTPVFNITSDDVRISDGQPRSKSYLSADLGDAFTAGGLAFWEWCQSLN